MLFYFIFSIIIFCALIFCNDKNKLYKKISIIIVTIIILLIYFLRDKTVGMGDVEKLYIPEYNSLLNFNMLEILIRFKDPIFYIFTKIIILVSNNNVQIWLGICACVYIIPTMIWIYKESKYPLISVLIFLSLNFFGTAFSGLRHCMACGILCFAYKYLKEKKLFKFLIVVIIASMFHISALVFLIIYPTIYLTNLEKNKKSKFYFLIFLLMISVIISYTCGEKIILFILNILINKFNLIRFDVYTGIGYSSLNLNLFLINFTLFIFSGYMFFFKNTEFSFKKDILFKAQFIGTMMLAFSNCLGEMYRLSYFFITYSMLLIPEAINSIKNVKIANTMILLFSIGLIFYFLFFSIYNNMLVPYILFK